MCFASAYLCCAGVLTCVYVCVVCTAALLNCHSFLPGILAAGTSGGNVLMWQWVGTNTGSSQVDGADNWEFKTFTSIGVPVNQLKVLALIHCRCCKSKGSRGQSGGRVEMG